MIFVIAYCRLKINLVILQCTIYNYNPIANMKNLFVTRFSILKRDQTFSNTVKNRANEDSIVSRSLKKRRREKQRIERLSHWNCSIHPCQSAGWSLIVWQGCSLTRAITRLMHTCRV